MIQRMTRFAIATLCALVLCAAATSARGEEDGVIILNLDNVEVKPATQPGYWIGIQGERIDDAFREKLKLKKNQGLIIEGVIEGSPAAKGGLAVGDIIVSIGDRLIGEPEQISRIIEQVKEGELKLNVLRGGKEKTIVVRPARRPATVFEAEEEEHEEHENRERPAAPQGRAGGGIVIRPNPGQPGAPVNPPKPIQIPLPPGASLPPGMPMPGAGERVLFLRTEVPAPALPDDMEVSIVKRGKEPARITVKQGVKMWSTTEDEMDMLPAPARAYAGRALGKPHEVTTFRVAPGMHGAAPGMPPRPGFNPSPRGEGAAEGNKPIIRNLPGGGIQIELREGNEREEPKAKESKESKELKKPAVKVESREIELKRSEGGKEADTKASKELREQLEKLRKELQERNKQLQKKDGERKEREEKEDDDDDDDD